MISCQRTDFAPTNAGPNVGIAFKGMAAAASRVLFALDWNARVSSAPFRRTFTSTDVTPSPSSGSRLRKLVSPNTKCSPGVTSACAVSAEGINTGSNRLKVGGVDAMPDTTKMIRLKANRHIAKFVDVGQSVGSFRASTPTDPSISLGINVGRPEPTAPGAIRIDFCPESGRE